MISSILLNLPQMRQMLLTASNKNQSPWSWQHLVTTLWPCEVLGSGKVTCNKWRQERWLDLKSGRRRPIGRTLRGDLQISAGGDNWLINRRAGGDHLVLTLIVLLPWLLSGPTTQQYVAGNCLQGGASDFVTCGCHVSYLSTQTFFARSFQHIVYPWYNLLYGCTACVLCPDDKDN